MNGINHHNNLLYNVSKLCKVLNENNIKNTTFKNSEQILIDWVAYTEKPSATFLGSICQNPKAYDFLKKNGYIDIGICWMCGEEPINNQYLFTDAFKKNVNFYICENCYKSRGKVENKPQDKLSFFKLFIYAFIIYIVIKLFKLIF